MDNRIPQALIAIVSEVCSEAETHATLDGLFMYAGAPGDPPKGSKHAKSLLWLRQVNSKCVNPLGVLGLIVEKYLEATVDPFAWDAVHVERWRERIELALREQGMSYSRGGIISRFGIGTPSLTLDAIIKKRDFESVNIEFERALVNVDTSPRDAISAAANLLESICKVYIEEQGLKMPAKQDLKSVWGVVRKDLKLDPSITEERDIQEILAGMIGFVGGLAALRTHASSAHGSGKKVYRLEPRHARLAVHGAHTLALFILESWDKKLIKSHP